MVLRRAEEREDNAAEGAAGRGFGSGVDCVGDELVVRVDGVLDFDVEFAAHRGGGWRREWAGEEG